MKTTGFKDDEGNVIGFDITFNGQTRRVYRDGNRFTYNGTTDTLKAIKAIIEAEILFPDEETASEPTNEPAETWDCIHPCAIIVRLLEATTQPLTPEIAETLDASGYLLPDGTADVEQAEREIARRRDVIDQQSLQSQGI